MSGSKSVLMVALVALVVSWGVMSLLPTAMAAPGEETARHDVVYTCGCGPECKCSTVKAEPGTCGCEELVTYDVGLFLVNMLAGYLASGGTELTVDLCQSRGDCAYLPDYPEVRSEEDLP